MIQPALINLKKVKRLQNVLAQRMQNADNVILLMEKIKDAQSNQEVSLTRHVNHVKMKNWSL